MAATFPEHFALKGDNGKYLQAHSQDGLHYLQFSSDDAYDESCGFRAELRSDGNVRIKSDHFGKFWRLSPNWILADEDRPSEHHRYDDAFWPVWIDKTIVALRNRENNNYGVRLPDLDKKSDCLNASVSTITDQATLEVKDLGAEED